MVELRAPRREESETNAGRGCARAVLGVDAASPTGAHRLYENAGMRALSRFDVYEQPR